MQLQTFVRPRLAVVMAFPGESRSIQCFVYSFCKLGVPLVQLDPVKPDKGIREALGDWRY